MFKYSVYFPLCDSDMTDLSFRYVKHIGSTVIFRFII